MASIFSKLILLSALVLIALGGYLLFVSNSAPNFYLFGDIDEMALIIFLSSGFLIVIWIVLYFMSRNQRTN